MLWDKDFFNTQDSLMDPSADVIDVTPIRQRPKTVEEYLRYLYEDDGVPMLEKILVLHPYE